jgi:hypothetical protein
MVSVPEAKSNLLVWTFALPSPRVLHRVLPVKMEAGLPPVGQRHTDIQGAQLCVEVTFEAMGL